MLNAPLSAPALSAPCHREFEPFGSFAQEPFLIVKVGCFVGLSHRGSRFFPALRGRRHRVGFAVETIHGGVVRASARVYSKIIQELFLWLTQAFANTGLGHAKPRSRHFGMRRLKLGARIERSS
jgi:hypothetical protein